MPTTVAEPRALADLAVELAQGAGQVVRAGRRDGFAVDAKSTITDLVTEVDRSSERWLVEQVLARRPDDGVLGEEGGERAGSSGVRWILDPIDGTVNFVLGLPCYAVSVAAELDGSVVAGAVCNPVTGETFSAWRGGGAYLDGARLRGPRAVSLARAVVGTGFGYDSQRRVRQVAAVTRLLPLIADIRRLGAASLDICFVAAGRLDAHFEAGLNLWDYAAAALVAAEAGCAVSGLRGRPPSPRFLAVAGPDLAPDLLAALEECGADVLDAGD